MTMSLIKIILRISNFISWLPLQVLGVFTLIFSQVNQVVGELGHIFVVQHVYKGIFRKNILIIGSTKNHRDNVMFQSFEHLLSDVVSTHRVLQGEIEFII